MKRWQPTLLTTLAMLAGALSTMPAPVRAEGPATIPSCSPELVYAYAPGDVDVRGGGIGHTALFEVSDADGNLVSSSDATVEWTAHVLVDDHDMTVGAKPRLGGNLSLTVTTGDGVVLEFDATCMAGAGAYPGGIILYANGVARGWPGNPNGTVFVHFESWVEGPGATGAYVALVEGRDCMLDFRAVAWTPADYATGPGAFEGFRPYFAYSETDCHARRGSPKPAAKAPGRNR